MNLLRVVENWSAPYVLVVTAILLVWAVKAADGFGPLLSQPGKFGTLAEFLPVFVPSLTAMIGFWATLSLNMPDFTRFGRSQREQAIGQAVALPTTMFAFAAMGVLITSASAILYGEPIWDPIRLVGHFTNPWIVGFAMFSVVVATLAVNIAANVVSPANDFANALPRWISFRTGGLITGVDRHRHAAVEAARRSQGLHLHLARRLLGRSGLDRRRADRRLLDRAAPEPQPRRPLPAAGASTAAGAGRRSSRRSPAARSPGAGSSLRRCGRSTTTRGSSASPPPEGSTWA